MREVFKTLNEQLNAGQDVILAVVTASYGSAPQRPGAMMIVNKRGRICGTIGGGAIELFSEQKAAELLNIKQSAFHKYTLTKNEWEDIGMLCGGDADVLFQFVSASDPTWQSLTREVLALYETRQSGRLILRKDGSAPLLLKGFDHRDLDCEQDGTSVVIPVRSCERAIIFGGGHCACALAPLLRTVGFRVTIFEERPEFANRERFPSAEEIIIGDYTRIADSLKINAEDYLIVMTSGHLHDMDVQDQVLRGDFAYVGVIGSRSKTKAVNEMLRQRGVAEEKIQSVHTPIGLSILAVTPEEIAVSITAELIAVRAELRKQG